MIILHTLRRFLLQFLNVTFRIGYFFSIRFDL